MHDILDRHLGRNHPDINFNRLGDWMVPIPDDGGGDGATAELLDDDSKDNGSKDEGRMGTTRKWGGVDEKKEGKRIKEWFEHSSLDVSEDAAEGDAMRKPKEEKANNGGSGGATARLFDDEGGAGEDNGWKGGGVGSGSAPQAVVRKTGGGGRGGRGPTLRMAVKTARGGGGKGSNPGSTMRTTARMKMKRTGGRSVGRGEKLGSGLTMTAMTMTATKARGGRGGKGKPGSESAQDVVRTGTRGGRRGPACTTPSPPSPRSATNPVPSRSSLHVLLQRRPPCSPSREHSSAPPPSFPTCLPLPGISDPLALHSDRFAPS
ncbi:hypothetical protein BD779DRAFT_124179 [Infundibulicybe gibba]|nr:hypothetical protein BD779DRAFT_124179 [Infundibulicybe gibba]